MRGALRRGASGFVVGWFRKRRDEVEGVASSGERIVGIYNEVTTVYIQLWMRLGANVRKGPEYELSV